MSTFLVRVELHGVTSEIIYALLHAAMEKIGFSRKIVNNGGVSYWLPTALYIANSSGNATSVHQAVEAAVKSTKLSATIFVAQMSDWQASNLKPVQQQRGLVSSRY